MLQDKLSTVQLTVNPTKKVCCLCSSYAPSNEGDSYLLHHPTAGTESWYLLLLSAVQEGMQRSDEGASKKGTHPRPQWMKSRGVFLPKATRQNSSATFHSTKWLHDTSWSWTRQFLGKPHPWQSLLPSVLEASGLLLLTPLGQIWLSFRMQFQTPWHRSCPFGPHESGLSPAACWVSGSLRACSQEQRLSLDGPHRLSYPVCGTERSTNPVPKCLYFQHQGGQCFTCSSY